jgi:hypothetical protein
MADTWEMQMRGTWVDAPFKPPAKVEKGKKCTFTFQGVICNLEFQSETEAIVKSAKDGKEYACRPKKLAALDSHEENRRISQKRASAAVAGEQARLIAEMEHAAHDAVKEREEARKSVNEAVAAEQDRLIEEHGHSVRRSTSVPDPEILSGMVKDHWKDAEAEPHPDTKRKSEMEAAKLEPLDRHEEERISKRLSVKNSVAAEQMRQISEMEHAEHEAKEERKTNRKSALDAMSKEQEELVKEHGSSVRKSAASISLEQLQGHKLVQDGDDHAHTIS